MMRSHLAFLASGFFAALIGAMPAMGANPAPTDITMFPPITSTGGACTPGQGVNYMLMWDGATQVKCVPIQTNCTQWAAGTNAPAPGYGFATSQFLTYQNGALVCSNTQCPFPQVSEWNAQTKSVVCVDVSSQ